jgi:hypothetical protein
MGPTDAGATGGGAATGGGTALDAGHDAGVDAGFDAGPLFVDVSFPALTLAPEGDELVVRAGHGTTAGPGVGISVAVTGGVATSTTGITNSAGEFRTTITPAAQPTKSLSIQVTASEGTLAPATQTVDAGIADHGLLATYSNGTVVLEGPIRHGWEGTCTSTGNNIYNGVCTAVSSSPVDWAWGTFSASWQGLVKGPVTGLVAFQSWLWVDGVVHVTVDGVVVANLDTTGGGYSGAVSMVAGRWVPVSMTFAGNGGSNNMHLGWGGSPPTLPGVWEPVPLSWLATPR